MKVALVGASGMLGRSLVPQLAERHEVRALVRDTAKGRQYFGASAEVVECELLAPGIAEKLPALLEGCDAVIHAATAIPPTTKMGDPSAWVANTRLRIDGTTVLLATTLHIGAAVYLQQSIVMAYPDLGDQWISEDVPFYNPGPPSRTNATVIEMEALVRAVPTDRLRWCILRGGTFVGRETFQDDAIAELKAGTRKIPCDGRAYLPLIHVEDMASAFVAALERTTAGSTYNVVDKPIRQADYLTRLAEAVGAPKPAYDPSVTCPPSQRVSHQALTTALGWEPTHGVIPQE